MYSILLVSLTNFNDAISCGLFSYFSMELKDLQIYMLIMLSNFFSVIATICNRSILSSLTPYSSSFKISRQIKHLLSSLNHLNAQL